MCCCRVFCEVATWKPIQTLLADHTQVQLPRECDLPPFSLVLLIVTTIIYMCVCHIIYYCIVQYMSKIVSAKGNWQKLWSFSLLQIPGQELWKSFHTLAQPQPTSSSCEGGISSKPLRKLEIKVRQRSCILWSWPQMARPMVRKQCPMVTLFVKSSWRAASTQRFLGSFRLQYPIVLFHIISLSVTITARLTWKTKCGQVAVHKFVHGRHTTCFPQISHGFTRLKRKESNEFRAATCNFFPKNKCHQSPACCYPQVN